LAPEVDGIDQELASYRDRMRPPDEFEDGFNLKTVIGILFVGAVMMPSTIYLQLTVGQALGSAAVWVTVIIFSDIARRSLKPLKRSEIYMLVYVAAHMAVGGPFFRFLYLQYFAQSAIAQSHGIVLPSWVCPAADSVALAKRGFWHWDWTPAILLALIGGLLGRLSWMSAGYFFFRLTSDVERLPFPMAPIAAAGATALAETGKETWRWRVFSIGAMMGASFGAIYVLVPAVTQAFVGKPLFLIPIPWIDLTVRTETILPAASVGISTNMGALIWGMVLPFWMIVGSAIAAMAHMFVNPVLHSLGYLTSWRPGMGTIETEFMNNIDFWFSFIMGTTLAVALLGFYGVMKAVARSRKAEGARGSLTDIPKGRGDFPMWVAAVIFFGCQLAYVALCIYLIEGLHAIVILFLFFFALVYTPLVSYVNARMDGLTGLNVNFPFVREATFILSGYRGVDIWFAPFPIHQYGQSAQQFREFELTGTKFTSMFKAEAFMYPVVFIFSFLFCSYIWGSGDPIPSASYQWAQKMWHRQALQQCIIFSSTISRRSTTNACSFLPDGRVLTADSDGARIWEADGKSRVLSVRANGTTTIAPEPGGSLIATAELDGTVHFWSTSDPTRPATSLGGHEGVVTALEFSPDGALLASGSEDRTVRIWRTDGSGEPQVLKPRVGKVKSLSWRGGGLAVSGLEGPTEIWDPARGVRLRVVGRGALAVRFSADGGLLAEVGPDGSVVTYDAATGGPKGRAEAPEGLEILQASIGPDLKTLACVCEAGRLVIAEAGSVLFDDTVFRRGTTSVCVGDQGIIVGTREGPITVRDTRGQIQRTLLTPETRAESLFFKAWKPRLLFAGLGFGVITYAALASLGLPTLLLYGFVGGLARLPHDTIPLLIGALLGRYFRRKYGKQWPQYTPVLAAGFACGMGLVGMAGIAMSLLRTAVVTKPW